MFHCHVISRSNSEWLQCVTSYNRSKLDDSYNSYRNGIVRSRHSSCRRYGNHYNAVLLLQRRWLRYYLQKRECSRKPPVFYSIQDIRNKHDPEVIDNIYFLHAIGGCKTTSHIHSIGKGQPFKKFLNNNEFRLIAERFTSTSSTTPQIVEAGLRSLAMLYDGKIDESLDSLRFKQFSKKVATKTSAVLVNSLSPTTSAAKYHILRIYFQVQQWLGSSDLNPENFGWKRTSQVCDRLVDITMELLSKIRCQCKGSCSNLRCGCFKNQVKCTSACRVCCGIDCLNIYVPGDIETNDE